MSRSAFEQHICKTYGVESGDIKLDHNDFGGYLDSEIDGMWTAWKARDAEIEALRNALTDIAQNGERLGATFCTVVAENALKEAQS